MVKVPVKIKNKAFQEFQLQFFPFHFSLGPSSWCSKITSISGRNVHRRITLGDGVTFGAMCFDRPLILAFLFGRGLLSDGGRYMLLDKAFPSGTHH